MSIHCPYCNTTRVTGQGLVVMENTPLVQYQCENCGELFFSPDRRLDTPIEEPSE